MKNPVHVAIIMDGNGRWARERRHPRFWGHVRGSHRVSEIIEQADDMGIAALTLYAFSTENWNRPKEEIKILFRLLKKFILKERDRVLKNNIRFKVIGNYSLVSAETVVLIEDLEKRSANNTGLKLNIAFNYGGRAELLNAFNSFAKDYPGHFISEEDLSQRMETHGSGDVDLLIRTGGNQRISNFLIWQSAYAEIVFTDTKWPEFSPQEFVRHYKNFVDVERRFGSIGQIDSLAKSSQMARDQKQLYQQI